MTSGEEVGQALRAPAYACSREHGETTTGVRTDEKRLCGVSTPVEGSRTAREQVRDASRADRDELGLHAEVRPSSR